MTKMPIHEVDLEEIQSVEKGLLIEFDNNRGLVEALQIKFNLFCRIYDPVNNFHSHIIPFVFVEARASDVCLFCLICSGPSRWMGKSAPRQADPY